jgi:hypothetical protein
VWPATWSIDEAGDSEREFICVYEHIANYLQPQGHLRPLRSQQGSCGSPTVSEHDIQATSSPDKQPCVQRTPERVPSTQHRNDRHVYWLATLLPQALPTSRLDLPPVPLTRGSMAGVLTRTAWSIDEVGDDSEREFICMYDENSHCLRAFKSAHSPVVLRRLESTSVEPPVLLDGDR